MAKEESEGTGGGATEPAPVTRGEVITVSAALGAGYGAHLAIEAGAATGAAAIPIYGAAVGGLAGAAVVGWQVGTAISQIDKVEDYLHWMMDVYISGTGLPTGPLDPLREFMTPPEYPNLNYTFDYGESSTPQEVWWYVPEGGDFLTDTDMLYSNPLDAIEVIGVGGGAGLYFLIGDVSAV